MGVMSQSGKKKREVGEKAKRGLDQRMAEVLCGRKEKGERI